MSPFRVTNYRLIALAWLGTSAVSLGFFLRPEGVLAQAASKPKILDLTAPIAAGEEGYPYGPGMKVEGSTDNTRPANSDYHLPLQIRVAKSSVDSAGRFIFDVLVKNIGSDSFELPTSLNFTRIEKRGNKSQRQFLFLLTRGAEDLDPQSVGSAMGSTSVPGSVVRLAPGETARVLVAAARDQVLTKFTAGAKEVELRVACVEWQFDDDCYFIHAQSGFLLSENTVTFRLGDGKPTLVQP